jgi:ABC-2 type transport system permease protein
MTLRQGLRIVWYATQSGLSDFSAAFTWKTWLAAWYLRILAQVLFFASIGTLLGHGQTAYLLIGNSVFLMATHSLLATASTTWERDSGTLPLLVASPAPSWLVLLGRSLFWIPEGIACAVGALLIVGLPLGVPLPPVRVLLCLPMLLLIGVTTYALGVFLGATVLTRNDLRNVVGNAASTTMMALCGVNFPVAVLGPAARAVAGVLPLTHGLIAVRATLDHGVDAAVAAQLSYEAMTGLGWLAAAFVTLRWLETRSRRDGRIVFSG